MRNKKPDSMTSDPRGQYRTYFGYNFSIY